MKLEHSPNLESHPPERNFFQNRIRHCAIALLTLAAVAAVGCKKAAVPAAAPPDVQTTSITISNVPVYSEWVGSLDGFVNAQIHAQVGGYLIKQDYQEGRAVKKGDLLFEIDPRPFQAVLDQAQAKLGKTELDVKRLTPLAKENAVSQQELDDAVQNNLANQAAVDQAQLDLGFTRITSPIDGLAGLANAQIGDLVGPSTPALTTVATIEPIKAYFTASEQEYLSYVRRLDIHTLAERRAQEEALRFQLVLADGSTYPEEGKFYAADQKVDAMTGAIRLCAIFPNPAGILRPGQFARVRVVLNTMTNAMLVPQRAVYEVQGKYFIGVVGADKQAHLKPVETGPRFNSFWVVQSGLDPADQIVVEGVQKIRDGMTVNPSPWKPDNAGNSRN